MSRKNTTPDLAVRFTQAAGDAVHRVLAELHGNEFAVCFIAEHADAIQRAISKRLYGRPEALVLMATQLLCEGDGDPLDVT